MSNNSNSTNINNNSNSNNNNSNNNYNTNKKVRALVMYSGGLDSRLAVKILEEQDIEVVPILFELPISCIDNNLPFHNNPKIIDCTKGKFFNEFMEIIRHPKHGRGTAMNPCVDCKIFMIKRAKEMMKELDCQILATGEVIGERPKSQHRPSLDLIQKETGIEILRPLCAKELPQTLYEKNGLVDRNKLHSITGRRRLPQFKLAKEYKIQYPLPGGGCALCEKKFGAKMMHVLNTYNNVPPLLIKILKHNRLFYNNGYIIIAKNAKQGDYLMEINKKLNFNLIHDGKGPDLLYENKKDIDLVNKLRTA